MESAAQAKSRFDFLAGTGALRAKRTREATIRDGQISIPKIGQCYIRGTHSNLAKAMELEVIDAKNRKVVAKIVLSTDSKLDTREGQLIVGHGEDIETWKLVARKRHGEAGPYLALRLPEVQIARQDLVERGIAVKSRYVEG